jgi:tRNA modification GTPase
MVCTRDDETIIAQCTPRGNGALALLRLSGTDVRTIVTGFAYLPSRKKINELASHTIHYGQVIDKGGNHIDYVMFIIMDGPKTFTGQNTIEITCHNNPFIIDAIITQAINNGARAAQEGEFTKRAFLNGKIDLLQAEAINELIHANTQLALKKSLAQLEGSFSHYIDGIEKELLRTLAWCEASFEFLDEELEFGNRIKDQLELILSKLAELKKTFDAQQQIRQGIRIALIGSVNAGKSSLFNALLDQNRSIVAALAGTTRDVIEAGVYRNGNYWTLVDTAGLRQATDSIEQEGIHRSFEQAYKADIIILVFDGSRALSDEEWRCYQELLAKWSQKIVLVHHKSDLPDWPNHALKEYTTIRCSSKDKKNIPLLQQALEEKISMVCSVLESPFLLNQRQFTLLIGLENKLVTIVTMLNQPTIAYELVSYTLKDALEQMSELTGRSISQAGMDMVFKEFCVGK